MTSATSLADALDAAIGANAKDQEPAGYLDTGYAPLNRIISGRYDRGIPYGRITEIYGPSSAGKTSLAVKLMVEAQKAGGIAALMDHEHAFVQPMAVKHGLDVSPGRWVYKRPNTWEESNTIAMKLAEVVRSKKLIPHEAPIVIVFDSVAAMIPRSVFEKGIDEYSMNDTTALARVASTTLKAVNKITSDLNVTMVYLNQVRTKPGVVYGDPTTTPGGMAMEYFATVRLALSRKKIMEQRDGEKEMTGQIITIKTVKNRLTRPFQEAELRLSFDQEGASHFDETASLVDFLLGEGRLSSSGPRITWTDGKSYFKGAFVEKVKAEGLYPELLKLLPGAAA
jgi:protein RecA